MPASQTRARKRSAVAGRVQDADGSTRSPAGSNYGDVAPSDTGVLSQAGDPSRGHEMERDALPPDADFSRPIANGTEHASEMPGAGDAQGGIEGAAHSSDMQDVIAQAAYAKYLQRRDAGTDGSAVDDWLAAEVEILAGPGAR